MAQPDVTKIVQGGQNRVQVYSKEVTEQPTGSVVFTDDDLVSYLSDVGDMGASRDVQEISLFHLKNAAKLPGKSTAKDLQITEALTTEQKNIRRTQYENGKFIVMCMFDNEGALLYGCFGTISEWGMTLSDGDVCQLTYTLAVTADDITGTRPAQSK